MFQSLLIIAVLTADANAQSSSTNRAPAPQRVVIPVSFEEIISFHGNDFLQAADFWLGTPDPPLSLDDLWRLVHKLELERQQTNTVERLPGVYSRVVAALGECGGRADYEKLVALYDTIPIKSGLRDKLFEPLSEFWIKLELVAAAKESRRSPASIPKDETPLSEVPHAAPEVQEAWRTYRALLTKLDAELNRTVSNEWLSITQNPTRFRKAIGNVLREQSVGTCETLMRFRERWWSAAEREGSSAQPVSPTALRRRILRQSTTDEPSEPAIQPEPDSVSATGSTHSASSPTSVPRRGAETPARSKVRLHSRPLSRALIMCQLKQRRYDLAVATMLASTDAETSIFTEARKQKGWQRQLIDVSGLDWESLYAGAIAQGTSDASLRPLARDGSVRTARLLAGMPRFSNRTVRATYLHAIGAFVTPSGLDSKYPVAIAAVIRRESAEPIPDDLQRQLLQILCEAVNAEAEVATLETVSSVLARLCRPETTETLRRLLDSPFTKVQQHAGLALKALGEIDSLPPVPPPVSFRLLVDGQPATVTPITWRILPGTNVNRMWEHSHHARTDDLGCVTLDRDYFVDPKYRVRAVLFSASTLSALDGLWFMLSANQPSDLAARTDLQVATSTLTINIAPSKPNRQPRDARCTVRLHAEPPIELRRGVEPASNDIEVPLTDKVVFRSLQRGRYSVQLLAPGAARWESEWIELTEEPAEVTAGLQPGADVKLEIVGVTADGEERPVSFSIERERKLLRAYQHYKSRTWRGLPLGTYRIKIHSNQETTAYSGTDRTFSIDQATPALLDLGVMRLKSAD